MTSVNLLSEAGSKRSEANVPGAPQRQKDAPGAPRKQNEMAGARRVGVRAVRALIRENLRRYWTVAFVSGLGYFLVSVLPILINYHQYDLISEYTQMTVAGHNPLVLIIDVLLAVIISVCVLDYLHRPAASIALHSMPAKRRHLMDASMLSGMLLMLLPLLITVVLILACSGASSSVGTEGSHSETSMVTAAEHITLITCGIWVLNNLIVCGYTFVVSCLAGVVAGTRPIHVLTALFFNSLPGIAIGTWVAYSAMFLQGFYLSGDRYLEMTARTSPVLYCGMGSTLGGSQVAGFAGFALASVVLAAAVYLIYSKVRLEREGDATVFPLVSDLLCMAVSFVCMSGFAALAAGLSVLDGQNLDRQFLIYASISGVVFFLIFRMVADSSTRIFNLRNLLKFCMFVALTAVVFAFTVFDVQGFAGKVPASSDVNSVGITSQELFCREAVFTDPAQIETVCRLHQAAADDQDDSEYVLSDVVFRYKLADGSTMVREYQLDQKELSILEDLQDTKPFRDALQLQLSGTGKNQRINGHKADVLLLDYDESDETINVLQRDVPAVVEALNKDLAVVSVEEVMGFETTGPVVQLDIQVQLSEDGLDWSYSIDRKWSNTLNCLKKLGYMEKLNTQSDGKSA